MLKIKIKIKNAQQLNMQSTIIVLLLYTGTRNMVHCRMNVVMLTFSMVKVC